MNGSLRARGGFSLIELLVVVAIVAVLAALTLLVANGIRSKASMGKEISAGRQLMTAYHAYAAAHDGELLPGYGDFSANDEQGNPVHSPVNCRYPWRLAPYFNYEMRVLWGNNHEDRLSKLAAGSRDSYIYGVSVQPALGINAAFVGGDYQTLPPNKAKTSERYGQFCVTRTIQAAKPQMLIVFASAGANYEGERLSGYFKVEAPKLTGANWKRTNAERPEPEDVGHVDFRYEGKAVAAMLDGHVELLGFDQMRDMRRWSNQAGLANNPDWTLGMSEEPSSGGGGSSGGSAPTGDHVNGIPANQAP